MRCFNPAFSVLAATFACALLFPQAATAMPHPASTCANTTAQTAGTLPTVDLPQSRLELMRMQQSDIATPTETLSPSSSTTSLPVGEWHHCPPGQSGLLPEIDNALEYPQPALKSARDNDAPDVFGSVAVPVAHTPLDTKWQSASQAKLVSSSGPWAQMLKSTSGQSHTMKVRAVNNWVNGHVRFTDDRANRQGADRWSGAAETLRSRRGDCEDYAIAKMKLLEAIGVERGDMYLVIVDDLVRRADHALLIVRIGDQMWVLDNETDKILNAQQVVDYRPIFSYGATGSWIHGYAEKTERIAAL
jgi:predicted transglutaminase-like cysteine proteinase